MYKKTRREIPTACFLRYGGAVLFPVLLLVALILFLLIALVLLLVLILVLVVLTIIIVVLHEMTSFRPIGYRHILDSAAGKYAFLSKKRKKLLTNPMPAGKLNQQNKEG